MGRELIQVDPKTHRSAFTLIELLVVIAILVLLVAILSPSLSRARRQAQAIACRSNVAKWAEAIHMYASQHGGNFWLEKYHSGSWMEDLRVYYGDIADFRCCPRARTTGIGFGSTLTAWGPNMQAHGFRPQDYGSYGVNHWVNSLPKGTAGWRGHPEWQWQGTWACTNASRVPVMGDCVWYGGNPFDFESGTPMGLVPPIPDWNEANPWHWQYDMSRFCIDRHNGGINMSFADGSARKVALPELWNIKWHKGFRTRDDVAIAWLP